MSDYKYGAFAQLGADAVQSAASSGSVPVYIGTAPVNLLGSSDGKVNVPIKIRSLNEAQQLLGHFGDGSKWSKYTLCEAVAAHFANGKGNIGPIYVINVLDPAAHKKDESTTTSLTFVNKRATIVGDDIILSSFALDGKALGTDYTLSYDFNKSTLTVTDISAEGISEPIQATYDEVDHKKITAAEIIGGADESGNLTGISAVALVYQTCNVVPTHLAAPGWSDQKSVYNALLSASQQINGHWYAFVFADLAIAETTTRAAAKKWKEDNGYTSGFSKVFWPKAKGSDGNVYSLSTLALVEQLRTDAANGDIPFETCGNKTIPITGLYFGEGVKANFDKLQANDLTAAGITTAIYWEGNWRVWGDHTAAYTFGASGDVRNNFDVNIMMLFYIMNSFQKEWGSVIDQPMTVALSQTILNREQEKLDSLVARGALIGNPLVTFDESNNPDADIREGQFVWEISATNTPPLKAATAIVRYTDAGYSVYVNESGGEE